MSVYRACAVAMDEAGHPGVASNRDNGLRAVTRTQEAQRDQTEKGRHEVS
jgi:hypothetical protein